MHSVYPYIATGPSNYPKNDEIRRKTTKDRRNIEQEKCRALEINIRYLTQSDASLSRLSPSSG